MRSAVLSWRFPKQVEIGPGSLDRLGPTLADRGFRRAFLVGDAGVAAVGILDRATASLEAAGLELTLYADVPGEPAADDVDRAAAAGRASKADVVVGVGGGSVLDTAKAVALLAPGGGRISGHWAGKAFTGIPLPLALVPTTAGTGSEMTDALIVADRATMSKRALRHWAMMAEVAVLDFELTLSLPPRVTADTGMDALAHAVEAYVGRGASPFSDGLAEESVRLVARWLTRAFREPGDRAAREGMLTAAGLAGMACGNAGLGAVHALGYPLDVRYRVPHGRTNAVFLAPVLRFSAVGCRPRLDRLGELVGREFVSWIQDLLDGLEIPARLRDYGVPEEAAAGLGREGLETGARLLGNAPRPLTPEDAEAIARSVW